MFSLAERMILNQLSYKLYGAESKWQKIMKHQSMQVVYDTYNKQEFDYAKSQDGSLRKTVKLVEKKMPLTRNMTFEEILSVLVTTLDKRVVSYITHKDNDFLHTLAASRAIRQELNFPIRIIISDNDKESFETKLKTLPEYVQEGVNQTLEHQKENGNYNSSYSVLNGLAFVNQLAELGDDNTKHQDVDDKFKTFEKIVAYQ